MLAYLENLRRIIGAADAIKTALGQCDRQRQPLQLSGVKPQLEIPQEAQILSEELFTRLPSSIREPTVRLAMRHMWKCHDRIDTAFRKTISQMESLGDASIRTDAEVETSIARHFEETFQYQVQRIRAAVAEQCESALEQKAHPSQNKPNAFDYRITSLLEVAYSRTLSPSHKENQLLADASGLTPHQVRTWFQNRRNRKKVIERRNASLPALRDNVNRPPERRVASLPKRATKKFINNNEEAFALPPVPSHRPTRGLPRRAKPSPQHDQPESSAHPGSIGMSRSSSSTGSELSFASSLDSIPSNGGFTSPLDGQTNAPIVTMNQPLISDDYASWRGGAIYLPTDGFTPTLEFTPPTPFRGGFQPSTFTESPADLLALFSPENTFTSMGNNASETTSEINQVEANNLANFNFDIDSLIPAFDEADFASLLQAALQDPESLKSFNEWTTLGESPAPTGQPPLPSQHDAGLTAAEKGKGKVTDGSVDFCDTTLFGEDDMLNLAELFNLDVQEPLSIPADHNGTQSPEVSPGQASSEVLSSGISSTSDELPSVLLPITPGGASAPQSSSSSSASPVEGSAVSANCNVTQSWSASHSPSTSGNPTHDVFGPFKSGSPNHGHDGSSMTTTLAEFPNILSAFMFPQAAYHLPPIRTFDHPAPAHVSLTEKASLTQAAKPLNNEEAVANANEAVPKWMTGVLAFDCEGEEWEEWDGKYGIGGDWDFGMMDLEMKTGMGSDADVKMGMGMGMEVDGMQTPVEILV